MSEVMNPLVCHHRFNVVQTEIEAVLARTEDGDPQILPIVGPTRVGKSKLLASIIASHVQAEPGGRRKIIDVVSPKHLTGRALPDACLVSIGMSTALFRNHVLATDAFIKAVNKHSTRMLIFDETQHMLERGGRTTVRAAAGLCDGHARSRRERLRGNSPCWHSYHTMTSLTKASTAIC